MFCQVCGKEIAAETLVCPFCGASRTQGNPHRATIFLTKREAKKGCVKFLRMEGLLAPLRFELKPKIQNGRILTVKNARFRRADGSEITEPLEVTLLVMEEPKKKKRRLLPRLLLLLAVITAAVLYGMAKDGVFDTPKRTDEEILRAAEETIPHFGDRYFLSRMTAEDLSVALDLYVAVMDFEESCKVQCEIRIERLEDLFLILRLECPELFQVDFAQNYTYSYDRDSGYVEEVFFTYAMEEAEYEEKRAAVETVIAAIVSQTEGMNDEEKEQFVFDYIARRCYYEMDAEDSWNPYGTLISGKAKCDGISLAVKWLLEEMGIECLCVTGDTIGSDIGHAWNIVCLEGEYYVLDLTQSVRQEGTVERLEDEIIYYAYNVTDDWLEEQYVLHDRFETVAELPPCESMENSYYYERGAFIESRGDITAVLERTLAAGIDKTGGMAALQFASDDDLSHFIENIGDYINEWKEAAGVADLNAGYILSDVFNVCVIYME